MRQAATLAWLLLVVGAVAAAVARFDRDPEAPFRSALLKTSLVLATLAVLAIETASALTMLAATPLLVFSAVVVAASASLCATTPPAREQSLRAWRREAARVYGSAERHRILLLLAAGCALVTLLTAVVTPPNNWDAMTYHMPRVAHWLANRSLRHYPVARTPQLFMPPLNAYLIAIVQAVAASDVWANLVQWAAYVGGAAVASLAVRRLNGGPTAELAAAFAFLTLPMAIAQASTTQADLLTAYWVLCLIALIVGPAERTTPLWVGITVGLGMLTKPSFAMYAGPLVLALLVRRMRRDHGARGLVSATVAAVTIALVALTLQVPHLTRTAATFGTPFGDDGEVAPMQNESLGPRSWLSNFLRGTAVHVPIPGYGAAIILFHQWLGIDPDDPRTTNLRDPSFSTVAGQWFRPLIPSENSVGNPAHFLTALILLLAVVVRPRGWSPSVATALAIAVLGVAGWVLLSLPFKWQAWAARFDLPLFAALAIPFGIAMSETTPRAAALVMTSWLIGALPTLTLAVHRPLIGADLLTRVPGARSAITAVAGDHMRQVVDARAAAAPSVLGAARDDTLFRSNRAVYPLYLAAVEAIRESKCTVIGLELERDDWEYPFWRLLGENTGAGVLRIESVGVTNASAALPPEGPTPCIVVSAVEASAFRDRAGWTATKLSDGRLFTIYRAPRSSDAG